MSCSIFNGRSMALKKACSNPRFTLDFFGNADFELLMKAQITRKKVHLPKLFFVN